MDAHVGAAEHAGLVVWDEGKGERAGAAGVVGEADRVPPWREWPYVGFRDAEGVIEPDTAS